ncbi:hypothetical protein B0T11DRAFT_67409 [Plectosphaerella cucumerina]|jgi:hypothetical protein|uniref:Uncharacterized protein n=1 Tax=Plectosphaerella cucumerina TaxID=40658 RepID=A0A8K0TJS8_9PEZI|nr:hypothetical protein B0T11DRAFT_67409 [Plectosphaerella cucumerina]
MARKDARTARERGCRTGEGPRHFRVATWRSTTPSCPPAMDICRPNDGPPFPWRGIREESVEYPFLFLGYCGLPRPVICHPGPRHRRQEWHHDRRSAEEGSALATTNAAWHGEKRCIRRRAIPTLKFAAASSAQQSLVSDVCDTHAGPVLVARHGPAQQSSKIAPVPSAVRDVAPCNRGRHLAYRSPPGRWSKTQDARHPQSSRLTWFSPAHNSFLLTSDAMRLVILACLPL